MVACVGESGVIVGGLGFWPQRWIPATSTPE